MIKDKGQNESHDHKIDHKPGGCKENNEYNDSDDTPFSVGGHIHYPELFVQFFPMLVKAVF